MALTRIPQSLLSGSGSKNYFSLSSANPDLESGVVTPWSACSVALTGGVPSGAITLSNSFFSLSVNNTTPLSGINDLLLTKTAFNALGGGFCSGVMTIDKEDRAKMLFLQFSYQANSVNFDASGSATQSLEWWIFDVTNSQWIQPSGYRGMTTNGSPDKCLLSFQTPSNGSQFRAVCFTAQPSSFAYTVNFDSFALGPQTVVTGAAMSSWTAFTPTCNWTNATVTGWRRRVGNNEEVKYKLVCSGVPSGSSLIINYPRTIDPAYTAYGTYFAYIEDNGISGYNASTNTGPSGAVLQVINAAGTYGVSTGVLPSTPFAFNTGDYVMGEFAYPVLGWDSNVQQSSDSDQRTVSFNGTAISGQAYTSVVTDIAFVASKDTHGAWSGNSYKVPVSGDYLTTHTIVANVANFYPAIYVNAVLVQYGTLQSSASNSSSGAVFLPGLKAGDVISLRVGTSGSLSNNCTFSIFKLSGSAVVQATESVACSYYTSLNGSIANTVTAVAPFGQNKIVDTHNAFNTTTNAFTAPVSGNYDIAAAVGTDASANTGFLYMIIRKNSSNFSIAYYAQSSTTVATTVSASLIISLKAGETCDVVMNYTQSVNRTISGSISIKLVK